jgi:hypothetical protein
MRRNARLMEYLLDSTLDLTGRKLMDSEFGGTYGVLLDTDPS